MLFFRRSFLALSLPLCALSLSAQSTTYTDGENSATAISSSGNITLGIATGTATQSGAIGGSGTVEKDGAGTLIFTGNNTYGGTLNITAGTVQVGNGGTSGSLSSTSAVQLAANTSLVFNLSGNYSYAKGILGAGISEIGSIVQNGSGTVTLSKQIAAGSILVNAGSLILTGSDRVNTATVAGGSLTLGSTGALANGFGSLVVSGGTLNTSTTLSTLTLQGNLALNSGTITSFGSAGGSLTLASGASFTMTGGTLDMTVGTTSNQLIGPGSGTLTLSGGNLALTEGSGFNYGTSYQLFTGFADTSYSALTVTGYDTSLYSASISASGDLSFSAVPEPATYALFAGCAALGVAVLHRRKRQAA